MDVVCNNTFLRNKRDLWNIESFRFPSLVVMKLVFYPYYFLNNGDSFGELALQGGNNKTRAATVITK